MPRKKTILACGPIAALLIYLGVGLADGAEGHEPVSAHAAVEMALERDFTVLKARQELERARSGTTGALLGMVVPEISAVGSYAFQKDSLDTNAFYFNGEPYSLYQLGLRADLPFFSGGKSWGVYQYARKEVTVRELELKIAERELTLRVLEAFERVLLNESRVKALTDMNTIQQKMVVISGSRYGVGREGRLDLLQAKTGLAMLTPALLQARNQLKISTLELAVLIKYPSPQALELQGALEVPAWEELLTKKSVLTEESPLEVQAANLRYLQVTDRKTVARSKLLPHLDGFASYGSLSTTVGHIFSSPSETWALGVALKLPISAALSWAYEDRALDAELAERDFDQTNLRQNWLVDRYRLEKELEFSKSVLEASKSALDQAHEALQYADVTYQIGKTSFLQYYQAQKNLLDTTIALSQARFDTFQTLARYFSVTGLPLQDLVTAAEAAGVRH